jgi:hypothetical protein
VDVSDDLPPPRRPLFFPVVIATVFLSIIGMSAGLVLGARQKAEDRALRAQQPTAAVTHNTNTSPPTSPPTSAHGRPCRDESQAVAQRFDATGTLYRKLRLRTKTSVVYICQDESGRLYYHANSGGDDAKWIENETALFLPDVRSEGGDAYVVTAPDGTNFSVTPKRLFITHKDGTPEEQPAV